MGWAEDLMGELVGKDSAGLEARLQQRAAQETGAQMLPAPPCPHLLVAWICDQLKHLVRMERQQRRGRHL